jgi:hypothetical protein
VCTGNNIHSCFHSQFRSQGFYQSFASASAQPGAWKSLILFIDKILTFSGAIEDGDNLCTLKAALGLHSELKPLIESGDFKVISEKMEVESLVKTVHDVLASWEERCDKAGILFLQAHEDKSLAGVQKLAKDHFSSSQLTPKLKEALTSLESYDFLKSLGAITVQTTAESLVKEVATFARATSINFEFLAQFDKTITDTKDKFVANFEEALEKFKDQVQEKLAEFQVPLDRCQ